MFHQHRFAPAALALSLVSLCFAGCSGVNAAGTSSVPFVAGNWQFSSSAVPAAHLASFSGALSGSTSAISGVLHAQAASACLAPGTAFEVSGSANRQGAVTLSGPLAGGTLSIQGNLASDGKSLTDASYTVSGGTCAFAQAAVASAQAYSPIDGAYTGSFTDADGVVATISANLSQSPAPNSQGNYILTGSAGLPNNPCFSSSTLTVTHTEVTGGTFTFTFTDPNTAASVTANGTFQPNPQVLTVTGWSLSGCGTDTGTGSMSTTSTTPAA
jgi:hypothetical protein